MYLEKLIVRNYRSVESADVDFDPGLNAIFGENGTGKSNLVQSILKILGPSYPGQNSFTADDHCKRDESREIEIGLAFNDSGARHILRWGAVGGARPRLQLDGRGVNDAERDQYCPVYFPAGREVRDLPGANKWNPIGRIIAELAARLKGDPGLKATFDAKALELNQVLEGSPDYNSFKDKLRAYASEHLGSRGAALDLQLKLIDPENTLRSLQLFEQQSGATYNVAMSGLGVQSGITMAALRAYAEISGGRFFIIADEPEAYLHPLSQEALRLVFEQLAVAGTQVILTTHSPHFISSGSLQGLHKVWMDGGATKVLTYTYQSQIGLMSSVGVPGADRASIEGRLSHHLSVEAKEGLFAKTVVLCEGDTEAGCLGVWGSMLGLDFPTRGIALVPAHGKLSLPALAFFYKSLGIPTYIVFDSDSGKTGPDRTKHASTNRLILRLAGEPEADFPPTGVQASHAVLSPDFERVIRASDPDYRTVEQSVDDELALNPDGSKGIRARYVALRYRASAKAVPVPIVSLIEGIRSFHGS